MSDSSKSPRSRQPGPEADRFSQLLEGLDAVVWEEDAEGALAFVSSRVESMLGHPVKRWLSDAGLWMSLIHPKDRKRVIEAHETLRQQGDRSRIEYRMIAADGRTVCVEDYVTAERDKAGHLTTLRGVTVDVTSHWEARQRLEESEERFRLTAEVSPDAIFIHEAGRLVYANRTAALALGYPIEEIIGRNATDFAAPEHREMLARRMRHPVDEPYELMALRRDGSTFPIEIHGRSATLRGRQVQIVLARDLTTIHRARMTEEEIKDLTSALQESQEQLFHSQKLEAIGRVAGGVAHDFNNLLTVILSYTQILLSDVADNDPRREDVEEIQRAAERAAALTRQLLAFSRKQSTQPRVLDVNEVVQDTEKMLRRLLSQRIEILLAISHATECIRADRGHLEQVLLNLAINASDAMPEGGLLTVSTDHMHVTDAEFPSRHMGVDVPRGTYVVLTVSDTGHGMTEDTKAHIFEPFFTTKAKGKGTGLGLASVYGIVKQAKGYLWVYSKLGAGTTFKLYFPKIEEKGKAAG